MIILDISHIKTEKLLPNPYQPRRRFESEDMLSLADSIKENGVLQPLLIRRINNSDYFEVIAGERRLRASILAGLEKVPCIEVDCGYEESAVFSILENIQRCDLSFFEEAAAIGQLIDHFGMTQSECAKRLGKSQSALSNKLRLLKLPVDVRYFIEKEGLTERHARALLKLESEKDIWAALNIIKEKRLNVEQTEKLIESLTDNTVKPKRNTVKIFRDVRIFINTVNRAIETMKASGINAETDKTETDDYIEFRVKIPKSEGLNTLKLKKA
ncbi:MAG: ParB/RepB/Spo0J family partition protein [Eubacterium sp.]|nr:ParB/RepB/Spo0J family partition protein [Eubacterium sp.]